MIAEREIFGERPCLRRADDVPALRKARDEDDSSKPGFTLAKVRMQLGLTKPRKARRKRTKR